MAEASGESSSATIGAPAGNAAPPPNPPTAPPAAPNLIAGKYASPDAFGKGLGSVLKLRGIAHEEGKPLWGEGGVFATQAAAETVYKGLAGNSAAPERIDSNLDGLVKVVGLDPAKLGEKWTTNNGLDEEDYKALGQLSITKDGKQYALSKEAVNELFGGKFKVAKIESERIKEVESQLHQGAVQIAGGTEEQFKALKEWASRLPPDQLAPYEARIKDPKTRLGVWRELRSMMDESTGATRTQRPIVGSMPQGVGAEPTTFEEVKSLRKRAQAGDVGAQQTLSAHADKIVRRFS